MSAQSSTMFNKLLSKSAWFLATSIDYIENVFDNDPAATYWSNRRLRVDGNKYNLDTNKAKSEYPAEVEALDGNTEATKLESNGAEENAEADQIKADALIAKDEEASRGEKQAPDDEKSDLLTTSTANEDVLTCRPPRLLPPPLIEADNGVSRCQTGESATEGHMTTSAPSTNKNLPYSKRNVSSGLQCSCHGASSCESDVNHVSSRAKPSFKFPSPNSTNKFAGATSAKEAQVVLPNDLSSGLREEEHDSAPLTSKAHVTKASDKKKLSGNTDTARHSGDLPDAPSICTNTLKTRLANEDSCDNLDAEYIYKNNGSNGRPKDFDDSVQYQDCVIRRAASTVRDEASNDALVDEKDGTKDPLGHTVNHNRKSTSPPATPRFELTNDILQRPAKEIVGASAVENGHSGARACSAEEWLSAQIYGIPGKEREIIALFCQIRDTVTGGSDDDISDEGDCGLAAMFLDLDDEDLRHDYVLAGIVNACDEPRRCDDETRSAYLSKRLGMLRLEETIKKTGASRQLVEGRPFDKDLTPHQGASIDESVSKDPKSRKMPDSEESKLPQSAELLSKTKDESLAVRPSSVAADAQPRTASDASEYSLNSLSPSVSQPKGKQRSAQEPRKPRTTSTQPGQLSPKPADMQQAQQPRSTIADGACIRVPDIITTKPEVAKPSELKKAPAPRGKHPRSHNTTTLKTAKPEDVRQAQTSMSTRQGGASERRPDVKARKPRKAKPSEPKGAPAPQGKHSQSQDIVSPKPTKSWQLTKPSPKPKVGQQAETPELTVDETSITTTTAKPIKTAEASPSELQKAPAPQVKGLRSQNSLTSERTSSQPYQPSLDRGDLQQNDKPESLVTGAVSLTMPDPKPTKPTGSTKAKPSELTKAPASAQTPEVSPNLALSSGTQTPHHRAQLLLGKRRRSMIDSMREPAGPREEPPFPHCKRQKIKVCESDTISIPTNTTSNEYKPELETEPILTPAAGLDAAKDGLHTGNDEHESASSGPEPDHNLDCRKTSVGESAVFEEASSISNPESRPVTHLSDAAGTTADPIFVPAAAAQQTEPAKDSTSQANLGAVRSEDQWDDYSGEQADLDRERADFTDDDDNEIMIEAPYPAVLTGSAAPQSFLGNILKVDCPNVLRFLNSRPLVDFCLGKLKKAKCQSSPATSKSKHPTMKPNCLRMGQNASNTANNAQRTSSPSSQQYKPEKTSTKPIGVMKTKARTPGWTQLKEAQIRRSLSPAVNEAYLVHMQLAMIQPLPAAPEQPSQEDPDAIEEDQNEMDTKEDDFDEYGNRVAHTASHDSGAIYGNGQTSTFSSAGTMSNPWPQVSVTYQAQALPSFNIGTVPTHVHALPIAMDVEHTSASNTAAVFPQSSSNSRGQNVVPLPCSNSGTIPTQTYSVPMAMDMDPVSPSNVAAVSTQSSQNFRAQNIVPPPSSASGTAANQFTPIRPSAPTPPESRASNSSRAANNAAADGKLEEGEISDDDEDGGDDEEEMPAAVIAAMTRKPRTEEDKRILQEYMAKKSKEDAEDKEPRGRTETR